MKQSVNSLSVFICFYFSAKIQVIKINLALFIQILVLNVLIFICYILKLVNILSELLVDLLLVYFLSYTQSKRGLQLFIKHILKITYL